MTNNKRLALCFAATLLSIKCLAQGVPVADTLEMRINEHNTVYVRAILDHTDTLTLNFDSGTTELVLTNDVLRDKLRQRIRLYNTVYELSLGNHVFKTKVYDAQLSGHGTDGRFGWDIFKGKAVALNYDLGQMIIYQSLPDFILKDSSYEQVDILHIEDLLFLKATISQSGTQVTDTFLFDTGYQRTVMLDGDVLRATNFPVAKMAEIKRVVMKSAQGNEIPVITSNLESFQMGSYELKNVPVQRITSSKPMRDHNVHILGNEVLKRFNCVIDFQNDVLYLKPNKLYDVGYVEKS